MSENERLNALYRYKILDTPPEQVFDDITQLAAGICNTPISAVSLIDHDRQWFKSAIGLEAKQTERCVAFCDHAIRDHNLTIVMDPTQDPRFSSNPFVTTDPGIRFYAGAPLITPDNQVIGTLCVVSHQQMNLNEFQKAALKKLARQVVELMELRLKAQELHESSAAMGFLNSISKLVSEGSNFTSGIEKCLQAIAQFYNCSVAHFYTVEHTDNQKLRSSGIWYFEDQLQFQEFKNVTEKILIKVGDGLPGRTFATGQVTWINEISENDLLVRKDACHKANLKSAFAIPLVSDKSVIGVIELFSKQKLNPNDKFISLATQVGTHITQLFDKARANEDLMSSELKFRSVVQSANDAVVAANTEGKIISWNKAAERIFGYSEKEAFGQSLTILMPEKFRNAHTAGMNRVRTNKVSTLAGKTLELVGLRRDGTEFPIEMSISMWSHHEQLSFTSIIRDITDRKLVEKELETSRLKLEERVQERTAELQTLTEAIPQIVWQINPDGHSIYMNKKWEEYTGTKPDGTSWEAVIHPDDVATSRSLWEQSLKTGEPYQTEYRLRSKDGAYRWYLARGSAVKDSSGKITNWIGTSTDIHDKKEAEAIQNNFFSLPDVMLCLATPEGYFTRLNSAWTETFGYTTEELTAEPWLKFVHPDDVEKTLKETQQLGNGKGSLNFENRYRCKDGTYKWIHWTSVPRDGVYYCAARDITHFKEASEKIRSSEMRFRKIFDSKMIGIMFWDSNGKITEANESFLEMLGYSRFEALSGNLDWQKLTPIEHHQTDLEAMDNVKQNGICPPYEKEFIRKDGARVPVLLGASALESRDFKGVSFVIDMTHQKKTESRFQTIVDQSPFATQILTVDGKVRSVNRAWQKLWNISDESVTNYILKDYNILQDSILIKLGLTKYIIQAFGGESVVTPAVFFDPSNNSKLGQSKWVEAHFSPVLSVDGKPTEVILMFNDVTEIKKSEEERMNLQVREKAALEIAKVKSQFLANMSHEIRTPINGVTGMLNLLLDSPLNTEQRDCLNSAKSAADSLLSIINDILDFSKIEAGKLDLEKIDFDLEHTLLDVEKTFIHSANLNGNRLTLDIKKDVPKYVKGDPGRIRQIITNLIGNALKFTKAGKVSVRVSLVQKSDKTFRIRCEVEDTGIGIPKESQTRLFQAFSQADNSTTRKFGGSGLGLSISKELVEKMSGSIGVISEPGQGSTFWFELQLEEGLITKRSSSVTIPNLSEKFGKLPRVLLAEDNVINQKIALALLDKMGIRAHAVATGKEALQALREIKYDLILMDCQMPEMDGYEATQNIRTNPTLAEFKSIPIIAMTANALKGDRDKCIEAGMNDYVSKPVSISELVALMEKYLLPQISNLNSIQAHVELSEPVLDQSVLDQLSELQDSLSENIVEELLKVFIDTTPGHIGILETACRNQQLKNAQNVAHSLKSGSANIGAMRISKICQLIEDLDQSSISKLATYIEALKAEFEALVKEADLLHKRASA